MTEFDEKIPPKSIQDDKNHLKKKLKAWIKCDFRHFETILYSAAFLSMGIAVSSNSVALVDLAEICNISIKDASWFISFFGIGLITSTLLFYIIGRRIHSSLKQCIYLMILGTGFFAISWVDNFYVMLFIFFLNGFGTAGQSLTGNTRVNDIWQEKTGPYLQILHTTFPVSGIIAPAIFKPFLSSKTIIKTKDAEINYFNKSLSTFLSNTTKTILNGTNKEYVFEKQSRIFIPYSICSAYSYILLICFAYAYYKRKNIKIPKKEVLSSKQEIDKCLASKIPGNDDDSEINNKKLNKETDVQRKDGICNDEKIEIEICNGEKLVKEKEEIEGNIEVEREEVVEIVSEKRNKETLDDDDIEKLRKIKRQFKIIAQISFFFVAFLQAGREYIVNTLSMPYSIECSGWKKSDGANVIMSIYIMYVILRSINVYLFKKIKIEWLVFANVVLATVSSIFFISTNHNENRTYMWISFVCNALAVSTTFTVTLMWSRTFLKVTPRFVASFLLCFYIGMSTWPVLTTYLFTEVHCVWYPLINLLLGIVWSIMVFIIYFVQLKRRSFKKKHSYIFL